MSMMFHHGLRQLLVFVISVMLIMKYCNSTFGQRVPTRILQPLNRRNAHYDAATCIVNFHLQQLHIKAVMLCLGIDAATDIIYKKCNSKEPFLILLYRLAKPTTLQQMEQEFGRDSTQLSRISATMTLE